MSQVVPEVLPLVPRPEDLQELLQVAALLHQAVLEALHLLEDLPQVQAACLLVLVVLPHPLQVPNLCN